MKVSLSFLFPIFWNPNPKWDYDSLWHLDFFQFSIFCWLIYLHISSSLDLGPMQVLAIGFQFPTGLDFVGLAYQGKDIVFRFIIEYT
jgi:hypothetical protein